uniref:Uncharacterized protein n=1 Tax=Oryza sativa subsp. japonica TaxID=39947 RepID=Q69Y36_ORYSJ|nr:hypothetical protein [Oryza sativa Japonica Group]
MLPPSIPLQIPPTGRLLLLLPAADAYSFAHLPRALPTCLLHPPIPVGDYYSSRSPPSPCL